MRRAFEHYFIFAQNTTVAANIELGCAQRARVIANMSSDVLNVPQWVRSWEAAGAPFSLPPPGSSVWRFFGKDFEQDLEFGWTRVRPFRGCIGGPEFSVAPIEIRRPKNP